MYWAEHRRHAARTGGPADIYVHRSFTFEVMEEERPSLAMEFVGPYLKPPEDPVDGLPRYNTNFALNVEAWDLTTTGQSVEHTVDIQMRHDAFEDPDLALAFHGDGCDAAGVSCSTENCELTPVP